MCHHEAAVKCNNEEADGRPGRPGRGEQERENKNPGIVSKQITGNKFLLETNNNFIGKQSSALDDSVRFKREKLTDKKSRKKSLSKEKFVIQDERYKHKTKSKHKQKNKKPVLKHLKHFNKTFRKVPQLDDVVKSKEVIKSLKLEHNDDVNNCSQSILCKSRKKEIRENLKLPPYHSKKNKNSGHPKTPTATLFKVPDRNAQPLNKSQKDIKVAPKLSVIRKEITTPPLKNEMDEDESEEISDDLNVKPPPEVVLIPQNLDDDTNIKWREDTVIQNPIKSDSEILQNKSKSELKADIPISSPRPTKIPFPVSPDQSHLSFRTKPLAKLPFSRVVAAQRKSGPGEFSPYISFPALLSNLTQSSRAVRKDLITLFYS